MTTKELISILPTGKKNGIKNEDLQKILGTDKRGVSLQIQHARNDGALILSGNGGYYLPANDDEIREFYNVMHARCISFLKAIKPAGDYLKKQGEIVQLNLWEMEK